jgi:8-oxo-dGTP pyrophosphatase MutT (NUDIX family)
LTTEDVVDRVVAAVLRRGDEVLLCHRHPDRAWYPDVWDLPGGHVEIAEEPPEALVRELREELAVELREPLGAPLCQIRDAAAGIEMTVWLIDYEGPITNAAPDEHDQLQWVTQTEIASLELAHPGYVALLDQALNA